MCGIKIEFRFLNQENVFYIAGDIDCMNGYFKKRFIAQITYTVCTRINYKIVPLTNLNKYLHYCIIGTE